MSQIRVEKKNKYTQIDNNLIQNRNLSLKAKGLLIYMLSLPDDWDYSISGLSTGCKEGKSSIRSAIDELMKQRYITRSLVRGADGLLGGYEYVVYEEPQPSCENPTTDSQSSEKRTQQIKDSTNKNETNTPYSPPEGDGAASDPEPVDKPAPADKPVPKSRTRRTRQKKSVPTHAPERFEQFWAIYPGGGSRLKAVEAWDALAPSDELMDEMALALKAQMRSRQWRDGIGIPHACRWLSNRRWTDKLPEEPQAREASGCSWSDAPD